MLKYDVLMIMERLDPSVEHWDDRKRSTGLTKEERWNDRKRGYLNDTTRFTQ
ncbi:MAG: hypothetical protein PG978_000988 [Wolbachia endosymbiont of Ctenocephalides felis wCfeF]|nr:MAG: hypothetical protein PG978_000988 [Wolbachia endosymbiont of Ctenocephalides felis wCfeF]